MMESLVMYCRLFRSLLSHLLRMLSSGPEFWGILNPDWFLCNKGHRQSPIDIKPGLLLYDPNLKSIFVNKNR